MVRLAGCVGVLALAAILVAACGGPATPSTAATTGSGPTAMASEPAESSPEGSSPGESTPPDAASDNPGASAPPGETAPPVASPGGGAACSGSHENRVFFEAIAAQVRWQVYCAVLPAGWFVDAGSFSLREGGRMEITYKGPNGARLTLEEGNVCTGGLSACTPRDHELGTAAFADRTGTLVTTDGSGGLALYVDGGGFPAWTATASDLDQATFVQFAAALAPVGG